MNFARLILLTSLCLLPCCSGCDSSTSQAKPQAVPTQSVALSSALENGAKAIPGLRDITFDDIKFEMEKTDPFVDSMLTDDIEEMFGKRIRIRGYMFPTLRKRGLRQFVLVRDNMECCFGPGAALFDCILVYMKPGQTAEYSVRPVAVDGEFKFEKFRDPEGVVRAIYRLDGDNVEL